MSLSGVVQKLESIDIRPDEIHDERLSNLTFKETQIAS